MNAPAHAASASKVEAVLDGRDAFAEDLFFRFLDVLGLTDLVNDAT